MQSANLDTLMTTEISIFAEGEQLSATRASAIIPPARASRFIQVKRADYADLQAGSAMDIAPQARILASDMWTPESWRKQKSALFLSIISRR